MFLVGIGDVDVAVYDAAECCCRAKAKATRCNICEKAWESDFPLLRHVGKGNVLWVELGLEKTNEQFNK
jgi:hypothetical protein